MDKDDRLEKAKAGIREQDANAEMAKANEEGASMEDRAKINKELAEAKEAKYEADPAIKPSAFIEAERAPEEADNPDPISSDEHEGAVFEGMNTSPHTIEGRPVVEPDKKDETKPEYRTEQPKVRRRRKVRRNL